MSATTLQRIRPCVSCGRSTRPSQLKLADYPGTVVRGDTHRCITCYVPHGSAKVAPQQETSSVVLAAVAVRYPQRADCRPSCCKTPYNCARGFECRCHGEES